VGEGPCFLVNAASFLAVIASLTRLDRGALAPSPPAERAAGQLREGLRYVAGAPTLLIPLLMMALVGCFGYEFSVSLPVMARSALHVGATGYGFMTSAMGVGAVLGGLVVAWRGTTGVRTLTVVAAAFSATFALAALAPTLPLELIALALLGWASISFMATGNSTLQLNADPSMRGRVMSLWFVAFQGSTPIGAPVIGWIIAAAGARAGLGAGAAICVLAALLGLLVLRRTTLRAAASVA
jgi:predicted MFS family arabinose efflux permease